MTQLAKDDDEHSIPIALRPAIEKIAKAFSERDYQLKIGSVEGVDAIDDETARMIAWNIDGYGDALTSLQDATWSRSRYRWMDGYWDGIVDLSTEQEPASDLALHFELREDQGISIKVTSVHVP